MIDQTNVSFFGVRYDKSDDDSSIASPCFEQYAMPNTSPRLEDYNQKSLREKPSLEISVKNLEGTAVPTLQRNGSSSFNITESIVSPVSKERFATLFTYLFKIFLGQIGFFGEATDGHAILYWLGACQISNC